MRIDDPHKARVLAELVETAGISYIETDTDLCITVWSKGAVQLFGASADDAVGSPLNRFIPVRDAEALNGSPDREKNVVFQKESQGQQIRYEIFHAPVSAPGGQPQGHALLVKDATRRLRDMARLKAHELYMEEIIGYAPVGIFQVGKAGNVTMANSEYAWLTGYESSQQVVQQVTDFLGQVFYDGDRAETFMFRLMEAEQVSRFRCRLRRRGGPPLWALCYARMIRDDAGRMNGFSGYVIDISDTVRAEQALKEANGKLMRLSVLDGLTQIPNRRRFDEHLEFEWHRQVREKGPISLILCDIDFFKIYNDTYGHQAGDECLKQVAKAIHSCVLRPCDLAARYGGEEFGVILPDTGSDGSGIVAEKIRQSVLGLDIAHKNSKVTPWVTLSLGVATLEPGKKGHTMDALMESADKALYEAKAQGRNRVIVFS